MDAVLNRRVLIPLGVLWMVCLIVSAIQGESEDASFVESLPWIVFLVLTLFFIVVVVLVGLRRARGRGDKSA